MNPRKNPHKIHEQHCRVVKEALEHSGYRCAKPKAIDSDVDIVATPIGGRRAINVRVRGRLYLDKKDQKKNRHIAFPERKAGRILVCLYPVDKMLQEAKRLKKITHTQCWKKKGVFHQTPTPGWAYDFLRRLTPDPVGVVQPKESAVEAAFLRATYRNMNARQQENYNFHKVAAIMADYGFNSMRLNDDWKFADFIAIHIDGATMLRIQLKSMLSVAEKYMGQGLHIGFLAGANAYVFPHDEFVRKAQHLGREFTQTVAWKKAGTYWPNIPKWAVELLAPYRLTPRT